MNRKIFLKGILAFGALLTGPFKVQSKPQADMRDGEGFMVRNGEDRFNTGSRFQCKVSGKDTDGDLYIFEQTRTTGGAGPHLHFEQDEWWYVISGEWEITVGDTTYHVKKGDSVFGPRKVPHSFNKLGTDEGTMLIVFQPAGKMEAYFEKIEQGVMAGMSQEEIVALANDHGMQPM